jgi:hypothetical protein
MKDLQALSCHVHSSDLRDLINTFDELIPILEGMETKIEELQSCVEVLNSTMFRKKETAKIRKERL